MRIPLTPFAVPEIALFTLIFGGATALAWAVHPALAVVPAALLAFSLSFFRDPERPIPGDDAALVSPADGRVSDVTQIPDAPYVGGPAVRVGIFLSVFDVHVNRVPLAGVVRHRVHRHGRFLDARDPRCAEENEAIEIGVECPQEGRPPVRILVRQITGLIARRIVCPVNVDDAFARGARYGMIKFGSRTELYVANRDIEAVTVSVGQKVKGGSSVIGRLKPPRPETPS